MKIKVCGMRDGENIRQVNELGINYIGLIFWEKSPRNVTMIPTGAGIIPDRGRSIPLSSSRKRKSCFVGVFVDETPQNIITRVVNFNLDVIQLHGHETPTMIRNLRATLDPDIRPNIQIWKAIPISPNENCVPTAYKEYEDCTDAFVFDTKSPSVGGSGQQYSWSVLESYNGQKPFLLSGGIGPEDAERIRNFHHPKCIGIDLNSRFETAPGLKNIEKIKQFLNELCRK